MKKIVYIIILLLQYGCPVYDPARGLLYIRNNSSEAIYVYLKCGNVDSLSLDPKLELFDYFDNDNKSMQDAAGNPLQSGFTSPEYRINAYEVGSLHISGSRKKPHLPCEGIDVTLFFITEKTMRNYDWEEIYEHQLFIKKITLTEEELENTNWIYTYSP
jgi:hypothetical protein